MKKWIFGRLHENVRIPLASADSHYRPLNTKQQKRNGRLMLKALRRASGDLKRLMSTGDIVQKFVKTEGK